MTERAPGGVPRNQLDFESGICKRFPFSRQLFLKADAFRIEHLGRRKGQANIFLAIAEKGGYFAIRYRAPLGCDVHRNMLQKGVFEIALQCLKSRARRIRIDGDALREAGSELTAYVVNHFTPLLFFQNVDFRQQYGDARRVPEQHLDQSDVLRGQRRINPDCDQCHVDLGRPTKGCLRIVSKNAVKSWRVDEPEAGPTRERCESHGNSDDPLAVRRVLRFRNIEA